MAVPKGKRCSSKVVQVTPPIAVTRGGEPYPITRAQSEANLSTMKDTKVT